MDIFLVITSKCVFFYIFVFKLVGAFAALSPFLPVRIAHLVLLSTFTDTDNCF